MKRVLVVDDDPSSIELLRAVLARLPLEVHAATSRGEAAAKMTSLRPQLVFLDLVMPGVRGMDLLEELIASDPRADLMLMTAHYSTDSAVEAIQKGAYDYLTKPLPIDTLRRKVQRWLEDSRQQDQAQQLESEELKAFAFQGMVSRSPQMQEVFSQIRRIAPQFANVLLTGETGTGKELAARALHNLGPRPAAPFVVVNCAAISDSLMESELFGHARGAFTGAVSDHKGLVEFASGGTLFLDEIAEVPLAAQAKLLRVLQNREVQRLGDPAVRTVDLRIVAATNRDLRAMTLQKNFRDDLYFRLSMVEIRLPRLADRKEDVALLAQHFLRTFSQQYGKPGLQLTRRANALLARYSWPGNVRELENVLSYCAMMSEKRAIDAEDLPEAVHGAAAQGGAFPSSQELVSLREMARRYVLHVLEQVNGNRVRAAQVLDIGRATLYRMLNSR
jgi:DNA-binding NtrC family response regulator